MLLSRWTVCILVATLALASASTDVQNGFFKGRSGNAVLKPLNFKEDSSVIFVDGQNYIESSSVPSTISLPYVADVISRSLGVEPMNTDYTPSFLTTDIFNTARANIFVSIPASKQSMKDANAANILTSGQLVDATEISYPNKAITQITTSTTGKQPSQHGIVNDEFYTATQTKNYAYSSAETDRMAANVADVLSQTFNAQSLIVSASMDSSMAASTCSSTRFSSNAANSFCVAFNDATNSMSAYNTVGSNNIIQQTVSQSLSLQINNLLSTLSGSFSCLKDLTGVSVQPAVNMITVEVQGRPVIFDLNAAETIGFFAELQYMYNLPTVLSSAAVKNLVQDNTPDLFSFHFSGLQSMLDNNKITVESEQYKAALYLIDSILPKVIRQLMSAYDGRVLAEILLTGSQVTPAQRQLQQLAQSQLPGQSFPLVQLGESTTCNNIPTFTGYEVACYQSFSASSFMETMSTSTSLSTAIAVQVELKSVEKYQIVLWISIALVFTVVSAVYSIGGMHIKKDTLVYGSFNPNWEGKRK